MRHPVRLLYSGELMGIHHPLSLYSHPSAGRLRGSHLAAIMAEMVKGNQAQYDPPNQTQTVLLYWRSPEEWAHVLHDWVCYHSSTRSHKMQQ